MEIRELKPEEYSLLELHPVAKEAITPENSTALGAFDETGTLVGQMLLIGMAHVEGTQVKKGTMTFFRLDKAMAELGRSKGLSTLLTYIGDEKMAEYAVRLGWKKLPVEVYSKEL